MEIITDVDHQPWKHEDVDEDELDVGLITRKKNLNQSPLSTTINVGVTNYHHQQQDEDDEEEEEVKDFTKQDDIKVDEDENEKDKQISDFCVHYNTDKGDGEIHVADNNIDIKNNNEDNGNGNGAHSVISKQNGEHQKHEILVEGDKSATSYIDNKSEISGIEVIKDGDDEITEYDVETVIKKQETHDLFCPNCNSCITKRVILRKRKRRVRVPDEDSKRSKSQILISSELNGVDYRLDDVQVQQSASNEYEYQRESDVFRCLSCFSIFMPTGDGFRLFRMFGNKSNEENIEHSHTEVSENKSWFSKFMRSKKVDHNVTNMNDSGSVQRLDVKENVNVGEVSSVSSNLNSSMQESNSRTSNGVTDLEKNQLQSDKVTKETNGKMETESTLADTQEQLLTSYHIEKEPNKSEYPGTFVVKPPLTNDVEPAESSISPLQHDGLKLLVPPNVGSLIIDNSHMNQDLDITVHTSSTDEKERADSSISPPVLNYGELNSGGLGLPIHLTINGKEQKRDKDSVQPTDVMLEASQHVVQNNVEIHLEEPLKVDKNVLTDNKQINILANVKNIESINGKDAIITIESPQLDATVIQRTTGALGATGTPVVQQGVEQVRVTMATGGGRSVDIIKSIVYGGLIELIASLSVVSSAAGGDAATLNVLALGLANIFGGLFVISHDLWDLKNERTRKTEDRYQKLLGQRADFPLHMTISLLSYLIFGFLPPIVYGFSFHESNDKDLKLLMVAAASILGIIILAAGKAYVQRPQKSYFKTIGYHVALGVMVSGVSYVFGGLIVKLLEKMDLFDEGSAQNLRIYGVNSNSALATY